MTDSDNDPNGPQGWRDFRPRDVHLAFALLTRLPLPPIHFDPAEKRPAAHGAWAYPLVGLAVGGFVLAVAMLLGELGASAPVAAGLALVAGALVTGAMHEDGLADCADGFWGGWTVERRLEIMKDSQIGTYGVLALILVLGSRWALLAQLISEGALAAAVLAAAVSSRAVMVWVMAALPAARTDGLSRQTGQPPMPSVLAALGIGVVVTALTVGHALFLIAALAGLTGFGLIRLARAKIGGQTGDVLGGTQQVIEVVILIGVTLTL
ncbi:adenosylcobinamide-GDP ribazoletransferase [Sulfitobacter sp. JB4-11]|uniref:adenosylcobinamide-GDP ribazoletransferase n=1 Tax=Sulfitobacter rhodophyticola TaxID=3238304 RepID=UPI003513BE80